MSAVDQCPSSKKEGKPALKPRALAEKSGATGKEYWRSAEELAGAPQAREWLEREFPAGASELTDEETRRDFLKLMGASLALAGVLAIPGCRRPDTKVLAYNREPENMVPGNPVFYATAMPLPGGGAQGLLGKTFTGRPVKLEGNPLHPINQGKSDLFAQAAILDIYDPDRSKEVKGPAPTDTWASFEEWAGGHFDRLGAKGGEGLWFLVEKATSPSRDAMRSRMLAKWKNAKWLAYEAIDRRNTIEGSRLALGGPTRARRNLAKAKAIVSFEEDFLGTGGCVSEARGFAAARRVTGKSAAQAEMNRLYVVESMMSLTGGAADHRLRVGPEQTVGLAVALAKAVMTKLGGAGTLNDAFARADAGTNAAWIDAAAEDLIEHKGAALVMVGERLPAPVHAMMHAVNAALGAVGPVVTYFPMGADEGADSLDSITTLARAIDAGKVDTLVVIGCNPAYDAPADLEFAAKFAKVPTTIHLGMYVDETGAASKWHVNRAHFLEAWGDATSADGSSSVIQPMVAPIFDGKTELELLATMIRDETTSGYEIVRRTWRERLGGADAGAFERSWRRALHDGLIAGADEKPAQAKLSAGTVATALAAMKAGEDAKGGLLHAIFVADPRLWDGRHANNAWMQETPHQITKITWDNPVLLSAATAARLKVESGHAVTVSKGGRSVDAVAFVQPGLADDTIVLTLGSGRRECGRIGKGQGYDYFPLRSGADYSGAGGFVVNPKSGKARDVAYAGLLANTQQHGSMEGRPIIREVDLDAWKKWGDKVFAEVDSYNATRTLNFAGALGDEAETPANRNIFLKKQAHPYVMGEEKGEHEGRQGQVYPSGMQQWGMSIDLTTCTGCGACVTACQAENNVPVVGKSEVWKGREMHWIRVDRYYAGAEGDPEMVVQPVACVHCENAPCETVCPVNATIHSPEGTNDMAYNRCIGTRYCSNNCPYKVRRFNWFDYATKQLHGGFGQLAEGLSKDYMPRSEHFVPPRFREKVSELSWMKNNPNVTVRTRGVMEKCTYCIQRINRARVETKMSDLKRIPDGFFETACQQACPSEAIVFGDISDANARVTALRDHGRSYMLLAYLNTRPRTTHMARLRNPNPKIRKPVEDPPLILEAVERGEHQGEHGGAEHAQGRVMSLPVLNGSGGSSVAASGRRGAVASILKGALA